MKTVRFEDLLKQYDEGMRQTEDYPQWHKAMTDVNICKLLMERHPNVDPNPAIADVVDATEMAEIIREAEAMTEAFIKSEIERGARELYRRLAGVAEAPGSKQ